MLEKEVPYVDRWKARTSPMVLHWNWYHYEYMVLHTRIHMNAYAQKEMWVYTHVYVLMNDTHMRLALAIKRESASKQWHTRSNEYTWNPETMSTNRSQHSGKRKLIPGLVRGTYKVTLEHSVVPESKKVLQKDGTNERLIESTAWMNLRIVTMKIILTQKNTYCTRLIHMKF